jgi:transposase
MKVLAQAVQEVTDQQVELAYVDQAYTGEDASQAAQSHGITLEVVKHHEAKRGFLLLPRRWVAERSFAWKTRIRRLAKDYERLPETVRGLHFVAFTCLIVHQLVSLLFGGS